MLVRHGCSQDELNISTDVVGGIPRLVNAGLMAVNVLNGGQVCLESLETVTATILANWCLVER